jgi:hypothetical protein
MIQAYKNFFKGFLDFSGRSTRSDFWWVWSINNIFCIPLYIIYFEMILNARKEIDPISGVAFLSLYIILSMVLFIPSLALKVRRLRDAGLHWAFIFFELIPLLAIFSGFIFLPVLSLDGVILLILLAFPTKELDASTTDETREVQDEALPFG